jgi:hypothetical protein
MSKKSRKHKSHRKKSNAKTKTHKNYLGGNINLAYPSNDIKTLSNPFIAYTGKGGNISNAYPARGPVSTEFNFLNPQTSQRGGCGCDNPPPMMGGRKKCSLCSLKWLGGEKPNTYKHRIGCKCSLCKNSKKGGGNNGLLYPNGLVGSPWQASPSGWPGVNNIVGDHNYLAQNKYDTDIQTAIIDNNNTLPLKGGKKQKKLCGGTLSNFIGQDLLNVGRQFQFGIGSAYNALAGYNAPANPLPWKDQLINTPSKAIY